MKYYAVTNDPAELMHYGIKGMKWGVIRTDAQLGHPKKPRSVAYVHASNKLSKLMKSGIKKAQANWKEYNSPANQKARAKQREAKKMDKYLEQARKGTLKYGKLTDAQVRRVQERLFLERQARQLGNTEKAGKLHRIKEAIGEGIVEGVGRGTASYINARMQGRGQTTAELKGLERKAKYEGKKSTIRRKVKQEADTEYYKTRAEEGVPLTWLGSKAEDFVTNAGRSLAAAAATYQGQPRAPVVYQRTDSNILGSSRRKYTARVKERNKRETQEEKIAEERRQRMERQQERLADKWNDRAIARQFALAYPSETKVATSTASRHKVRRNSSGLKSARVPKSRRKNPTRYVG